jgi:hypothetical protein
MCISVNAENPDPQFAWFYFFSEIALLRPHAKQNLSFLT